ncbi:MAG TPA: methylenetetrahydrofolate--tRNA-(uracil(54)-C(5))-methyltransferase (FADH(2)-oxidizing) TrmFO [Terriglobia bacterium]|nr:methylenetetrahydrofolate--tRNA-(uracil(54)-C(5))-methyltransferase (FADH(2)-oxidizing) TrmFO [Terriglobia bacterium]
MKPVVIAGGGLAGSEAAWQLAERGVAVTLYEMRPTCPTPAHKTDRLAELVCSNSLKSNAPGSASWLLKEELRHAGSLLLRIAGECAVPGGAALAVDRERFAESVTAAVAGHPLITLRRADLREIPDQGLALISTGPLTSDALAARLQALTGAENLAFYDAISPVVDAETLNMERIFAASRYGKGGEDYLNCPFTEDQYRVFYEALASAETVPAHEFEKVQFFEACLPIEELGRRGYDTLRFGPMKPVGLVDPRTGRQPFAVVQLRPENLRFSSYNLVGFQNHLKFPEQRRIMRLIPGLENAEFLRLGQIHRNTYINSPRLLSADLSFRSAPQVFVAGQLSGVEGYVECIATGLLAGLALAARALGGEAANGHVGASSAGPWPSAARPYMPPPRTTALGSLVHYITHASSTNYQPANISFDLLPPIENLPRPIARDRRARREKQCERALTDFESWIGATTNSQAVSIRQGIS